MAACGELGTKGRGSCGEEKKKKKEKKEGGERKREEGKGISSRDPKRICRDLRVRGKGPSAKSRKRRRVAAKRQGVGKEKARGKPGETLGLEVRWDWARFWAILSRLKFIFLFQINLAI